MTPRTANLLYAVNAFAAWSLILCAFFLPISPGAMNIAMGMAVIAKLSTTLSKIHRDALVAECMNPRFTGVWLFIALLALTSLHGNGSFDENIHYLNKYNEWLLMPVFAACIRHQKDWNNLTRAFVLSMVLCLAISVAHKYIGLDNLPARLLQALSLGPRNEPTVFKLRITFGLFMTFAGVYCLLHARKHLLYVVLGIAAWLDALLLIRSRTAFVTLGIMVVWLLYQNLSKKIAFLLSMLTLALATAAFTHINQLHESLAEIETSLAQWSPETTQHATSSEIRLDYWYGAWGVVKQAPVLGVGLGGYPSAYAQAVAGTKIPTDNNNPHQQYLLIAAQAGVVGLLIFLMSQAMLFNATKTLPIRENQLWIQIILISFAAGNLFNSFFLDSAEGLFFAIMLSTALSGRAYLIDKHATQLSTKDKHVGAF